MKTKDMPSIRGRKLADAAKTTVAAEIRAHTYHPATAYYLVLDAFMAGYRHAKKLDKKK